jgi:O-antigen ligase
MGAIVFLACFYAERYQTGVVLASPMLLAAGIVVVAACMGRLWAMKICLFAVIFGMEFGIKSAAGEGAGDASTAYKLAVWLTALVIGLVNLPASMRLLLNLPSLGLLAYLALAIASTTYSVDPRYTFGSAVAVLCLVPFAAAVVARLSVKELLVIFLLALGAHVALALVLWFVAPGIAVWGRSWGSQIRLRGLTGHPASMGDVAGLCLVTALLLWRERWLSTQAAIGVAILDVAALLLSGTRSSMLGAALAMSSVGRYRPVAIVLCVISLFGGLLVVYANPSALNAIAYEVARGDNADNVLTLSGRIHIWQQSLLLFEQRPLFGYGYASTRVLFLSEFTLDRSEGETPPHAHNVIVQSLVTTGIVGTAILLIPLLYPVVHALRNGNSTVNPFVCFVMIMGMMSAAPIGVTPDLLTLVWMITLYLIRSAALGETKDRAAWSHDSAGAYLANPVAKPASLAQPVLEQSRL